MSASLPRKKFTNGRLFFVEKSAEPKSWNIFSNSRDTKHMVESGVSKLPTHQDEGIVQVFWTMRYVEVVEDVTLQIGGTSVVASAIICSDAFIP
jgi:hypothetical protein